MNSFCGENPYISRWLRKAKLEEINNEVLLLFSTSIIGKSEITKTLNINLKSLEVTNYKLIDINEIDRVKHEKHDKNIILLSFIAVDIMKLVDIDYPILFCFPNYNNNLPLNIDNIMSREEIPSFRYLIETQSPLSIINNNISTLKARIMTLYRYNESLLFSNVKILQSNNLIDFGQWFSLISDDIKLLNSKRILTARLAVAIYKIATLKFNATNTTIGLYYRNSLSIKSKTMRIKVSGKSVPVKAYDLRHTQFID